MERAVTGVRGEMAARVAAKDWSATPLGARETWSPALETAVGMCLGSCFPMVLLWGPAETMVYNDAYRPVLGRRHPAALGDEAAAAWPEIWDQMGPAVDRVRRTGDAVWREDTRLVVERHGYPEETYWTLSMSPVLDEGEAAGVLAIGFDTTKRVVGERRTALVRRLIEIASQARSQAELYPALADAFEEAVDVPFARLQLLQADGSFTVPVMTGAAAEVPEDVLREALQGRPVDLPERGAVALPVRARGERCALGVLVAGLNPGRPVDDGARAFLDMVADGVATGLADVLAAEAERRSRLEAEALSAAKSAFLSTVSHEFRTPLTLLLGPIEDALAGEALSDADRERLLTAQRNALRLRRLVNSLLEFAAREDGGRPPEWHAVDLAGFTARLAEAFAPAARETGLTFEVDCPPLPRPVVIDPEGWERIVLNLLSNAFKYTWTGSIAVALRECDDGVELSVRDTGTGIPEGELPHLFERFHRVRSAEGRSHEGSGIGLALVAEIAAQHGGDVGVESALGEGSTFRVRIPYGHERVPPDHLVAAPVEPALIREYVADLPAWSGDDGEAEPVTGPRRRVLIADDNADMRAYLRGLLEREFEVELVADGDSALERALSDPPDLLLTDVMMPGLDGIELLKRLRATPSTERLPILLLSARAGREAAVEALDAGADDYLIKPFAAPELVARVRANLELGAMRERATRHQAALYAREHALVERLQRSLLPAELPELPDVRLAGRYLPASSEPAVGGDWFDVLRLPDERVLVVVGDVVGHGLEAASTMAHLRTATRAYAAEGHDAAGIVERVSMLVERTAVGLGSTMALAGIDAATGTFSYASAGHPPLIVCNRAGGARWLESALGPPLGLSGGGAPRQADDLLGAGESLLLYTDGLVERRRTELHERFDALAAAAAQAGGPPDALLDRVVAAMDVADGREDDVALIALERVAARSRTTFSVVDADDLGDARQALREWLAAADADDDTTDEVVLAVSEALINAIEHAGGDGTTVCATAYEDRMRIVIRDSGRWRRQGPARARGHGLRIMRALMDDVVVDPLSVGTRVELQRRIAR